MRTRTVKHIYIRKPKKLKKVYLISSCRNTKQSSLRLMFLKIQKIPRRSHIRINIRPENYMRNYLQHQKRDLNNNYKMDINFCAKQQQFAHISQPVTILNLKKMQKQGESSWKLGGNSKKLKWKICRHFLIIFKKCTTHFLSCLVNMKTKNRGLVMRKRLKGFTI